VAQHPGVVLLRSQEVWPGPGLHFPFTPLYGNPDRGPMCFCVPVHFGGGGMLCPSRFGPAEVVTHLPVRDQAVSVLCNFDYTERFETGNKYRPNKYKNDNHKQLKVNPWIE